MKLSFSTRGWAHLSWDEWMEAAISTKFEGIEVYNLPGQPELTEKSGPFHKYTMAATVRQLKEKKLSLPCFNTSYDLSDEEKDFMPTIRELIQMAKQMEVPYVSVVALHDN